MADPRRRLLLFFCCGLHAYCCIHRTHAITRLLKNHYLTELKSKRRDGDIPEVKSPNKKFVAVPFCLEVHQIQVREYIIALQATAGAVTLPRSLNSLKLSSMDSKRLICLVVMDSKCYNLYYNNSSSSTFIYIEIKIFSHKVNL